MADLIASDALLTEEQSQTLQLLLNMIIPPDAERGMPGAVELDFMGYVIEFANDRIEHIQRELDSLNESSRSQYTVTFPQLDDVDREALVKRLHSTRRQFARNIEVQTMFCYYQDDQVLEALGMEARPPFPKGNEVLRGDLSLLDPVRQRPKLYREILGSE